MKEITYFYLKTCPYCHQADRMIQDLIDREPQFSVVQIKKIEEREHAEIADRYDYYLSLIHIYASVSPTVPPKRDRRSGS